MHYPELSLFRFVVFTFMLLSQLIKFLDCISIYTNECLFRTQIKWQIYSILIHECNSFDFDIMNVLWNFSLKRNLRSNWHLLSTFSFLKCKTTFCNEIELSRNIQNKTRFSPKLSSFMIFCKIISTVLASFLMYANMHNKNKIINIKCINFSINHDLKQ